MNAFRVWKIRVEEGIATGEERLVILLCSARKEIDYDVVGLVQKKRLTKLCAIPVKRLDAGEADKPKEEKCEKISENKKNTDQKSDEYLELKDSKKDQVLNGACLEDSLDQGGPNRGQQRNFLRPAEQFYTI